MSSPSTPRSTRAASAGGDSPAILTPGQKVKAMLAQFDSDSESESEQKSRQPAKPAATTGSGEKPAPRDDSSDDDGDEDEDEDIVMPKGRMAARMQGKLQEAPKTTESAFERVSKALRAQKEGENKKEEEDVRMSTDDAKKSNDDAVSSDEELPTAGPRRLTKEDEQQESDGSLSRSPSPARSISPMVVSSPGKRRGSHGQQDDSDASEQEDPKPKDNSRLQALVAQKRKEREERERIEAEKKAAARAAQNEKFSSDVLSGEETDDNDAKSGGGSGQKMTQQSRPSRKASKKALEEMHRETQRMSRNMQLAHQAQTKKKITKESFLARFNSFGQSNTENAPASSSTAGSQNSSDGEVHKGRETPGTSPVLGPVDKRAEGASTSGQGKETQPEDTELPPIEDVLAGTHLQNDHQKTPNTKTNKTPKKASVRVQLSRQSVAQTQEDDSDSDLEVVTEPAKCQKLRIFENLPTHQKDESKSLLRLRALAHLTSPGRSKPTMDMAQHSADLLAKARQQAANERKERIEELRAKGVVIETADERAAMEDQIENLVEKARKEAADIAKMERKAKKQDNDEDDEENDVDYELSGSEEEGNSDGDEEGDEEENEDEEQEERAKPENDEQNLLENEAGEDDESDDGMSDAMSTDEATLPTARRKRPTRVISDDEDEEDEPQQTSQANPITPSKQASQLMEFPGMEGPSSMTMGLTQAFASTMAGSQQDPQPNTPMGFPSLPDPAQPDSPMVIKDSQGERAESDLFAAKFAPSEVGGGPESPAVREMSIFSQLPDPTQDEGFVLSPFDPSKRFRDPPHSTVETEIVGRDTESPGPQRKGKHLRRGRASSDPADTEKIEGDFEVDASAFDVMKKANKKKKQPSEQFDRKKSKAKDVVEEAAEESEDEYAGLGGGSDDDEDEEDAYDSTMINDNSDEKVDEKQLAALNASHARDADEKQVAQLLKDITTGALRRRRGGDDDLDLDDPEDELLARRREKQREFARMRNALLADGKVTEIAENPKKAAFFKAIEDRDDDDVDLDFLEEGNGDDNGQPSQDESSQDATTADAETDGKRKRPLEPSAEDIANRPPPHLRRTPASAMSKKPASLAEIRETLSFLTERHEYDSFHEDAAIDPDNDQNDDEMDEDEPETQTSAADEPQEDFIPRTHQNPRRTRNPNRVVDRLALRRQASSNSATSASTTSRTAFHAGGGKDPAAGIGFRPPPLLRKATTGSMSSSSSSSVSSSSSDAKKSMSTGASGTKKGAVNYYTAAREREREKATRVQERSGGSNVKALLEKHASNRLGALGKGQFE